MLVAEAGRGGSGPCVTGDEGKHCFGLTSALTAIAFGHQTRIIKGLPSLADPTGGEHVGVAVP